MDNNLTLATPTTTTSTTTGAAPQYGRKRRLDDDDDDWTSVASTTTTTTSPPDRDRDEADDEARVLRREDVQDVINRKLHFTNLQGAQQCQGMECLVRKVVCHRYQRDTPLYQSYMLQSFLQGPLAKSGVPTGYLLIQPNLQRKQYNCCFHTMNGVTPETILQRGIVIHVEILVTWMDGPDYANFLLYVCGDGAVAISIGAPRAVFNRIPWNTLYAKLFAGIRYPGVPPIIHLCNNEESNPFEPILWLHAALTAARRVNVLQTLLSIYKPQDPNHHPPELTGLALYELHAVDSFLPSAPDCSTQLKELLQRRRDDRKRLLDGGHAMLFQVPFEPATKS